MLCSCMQTYNVFEEELTLGSCTQYLNVTLSKPQSCILVILCLLCMQEFPGETVL